MVTGTDFDVIIIGAGPAGLECAHTLLNTPLKVLLIERKDEIGPKHCAGGVKDSESIVEIPVEQTKRLDSQLSVLGRTRCLIPLQDQFRCFERRDLGQYQLSKILPKPGTKNNISILCGTMVYEIFADRIVTSDGEYRFKYLVGADGASSMVRKYLKQPSSCTMGLYYNIRPTSEQLLSNYDPKALRTGYIWEFPHREYNNVGIYFDTKFLNAQAAKKMLQEYLHKQNYQYEEKDFAGALINYGYTGHQFGNIFLIGDAGGFTSRLHGGGISNGMESGRDVARLILDPEYDTTGIKKVLGIKHQEERLLNLAEKLPVWLLSLLLGILIRLMRSSFLQKHVHLV